MTVTVGCQPLTMGFHGVPPDTTGPDITTFGGDVPSFSGGVQFEEAPVAARVSARVAGDEQHFRVRDMFTLEWVDQIILPHPPPGEGPPHPTAHSTSLVRPALKERVLQVAAEVDGPGSIDVSVGQILLVRVQYMALAVEGNYSATVLITADTWDPVAIPVSMFLADITTTASDVLNIAQGGTANLAVDLHSTMGPAVDVTYAMSTTQLHTGLTLLPSTVHLEPKAVQPVTLTFRADRDAPIGGEDVAIVQQAFRPLGLFIHADITRAQITVNPATPNKLRPPAKNEAFPFPVHVALNGGAAAEVDFKVEAAPAGVSLSGGSYFVEADEDVTIDLLIGPDVPDTFDLSLVWSAFGGEQGGTLPYQVVVPKPIVLSAPIETGGLAALGGWVEVTVNPDGSTRWRGHAHDSGADGYDFSISAVVRSPVSGRAVAFVHSGSVGGTFTSGDRDNDWDESRPPNEKIAQVFDDYALAQHLDTHLEYSSDFGDALEGVLNWIVKFGIGTIAGPLAGAVVFIGVEVGSLLSSGSLVPGARVVEGILWMAGPENTLFAIVGEAIASVGSRSKELEPEWYDWANQQVFNGSLPPRDDIVLTDTIGPDSRAFTFPRYDGKITMNMGPDAYDDPRNYETGQGRRTGEIFVHELVHACQIDHTRNLSLLGEALSTKLCDAGPGDPYKYGLPDQPYTELNLEQQAQVVQDWFAGNRTIFGQTGIPQDTASPYYHYITDNVWIGVF